MFIGTAIAMCTGRTGRNLDLKVNMKLSLVKSINRETNKSGGGGGELHSKQWAFVCKMPLKMGVYNRF